jgi:peptidyl-prolyl cis-trans isomerase C
MIAMRMRAEAPRASRWLALALALLGVGCEGRDPVILTLDGAEVRRSEFLAYLKAIETRGEAPLDPDARAGLLDAFLEQRALVIEARRRGLLGTGSAPDEEARAVARLLGRELKPAEVSEQEIREYYGQHERELVRPPRVSLRQVLVPTLNEARDVKRRLTRDPKSFDSIARSQSKGPEAEAGGFMGVFEPGQLPAELEEVAFALDEGGTSDPVQSPLGYHVLRVDSRQAARAPSFEEAQNAIHDELSRKRRGEAERAFVAGIMARAKVNHAAALRIPAS